MNAYRPLAPSDTAKTAMISQRSSTRSRRDNSGASSGLVRRSGAPVRNDRACSSDGSVATGEAAWLRKELVEIAVLRASDECLDLGPGVDQRRAVRVRGVADGDLPVWQPGPFDAGVVVCPAGEPPLQVGQLTGGHSVVDPIGHGSSDLLQHPGQDLPGPVG